MNTIEALYYGNIIPAGRDVQMTRRSAKLLKLVARNEETLLETMNDQQKELLEKYRDSETKLQELTALEAFSYGFKAGARLTVEALLEGEDEEQ